MRRTSFHDQTANSPTKGKVDMSIYVNKVVLLVNVASKWGLTAQQYAGLNQLYEIYQSQGLEILGFPCNQFLGQEPGTNEHVQACTRKLDVKFPIYSKCAVNGSDVETVFQWVKSELPGFLGTTSVKWNFTKFLIDRDGGGFKRYSPSVDPMSLSDDIEELLSRPCTALVKEEDEVELASGVKELEL